MHEDQREATLKKIHTINMQDTQSNAVHIGVHPVMKDVLSQGINWIPNDILSSMVAKAVSLADHVSTPIQGVHMCCELLPQWKSGMF